MSDEKIFVWKLRHLKVADLPYDTHCLSSLANNREEVNVKSIERCRWEISRLKYSFTWKITFGEKLKTILFWGLHMTCHNFISSPLVHNRWKHWEVKGNLFRWLHFMSLLPTSGWRQCTTQPAWPPRWPSPRRWMKNNRMFAFNVFYSNL